MKTADVAELFFLFKPVKYGSLGWGEYRDEVFVEGDVVKYRLHSTIIAEFDGKWLTLRTGGWHTYTTYDRFNKLLRASRIPGLISRNSSIGSQPGKCFPILRMVDRDVCYPFVDDISISLSGFVRYPERLNLPDNFHQQVWDINERAEGTYTGLARALHILISKGYEEAVRYIERARKVAQKSRERMKELAEVIFIL